MTKSITKTSNLGYGWRGTLYSDGTMRVHEFDIDDESYVGTSIDLPKDSVDRLARIFSEIQDDWVSSYL